MRTAALLTAKDFARIAEVLGPCELVRGEIVPMSPGGIEHSEVTGRACLLVATFNRTHRLGRVLTGEAGLVVSRHPDTVRGADVAFVSHSRLPRDVADRTGFLRVPPELVIEILSRDTSWERMEEKIADYHRFGVDLVWVLDPQTLTLRAYGRDRTPLIFKDTDTISADPLVPGFSCPVSEFFRD
jgi:Uma2 family endonuclease